MTEAILFPGQGAQQPGMGREMAEAFPAAMELYEVAERAIDFPLRDAIWERGDEVHRTDVAQPGILVTSAYAANAVPVTEFTLAEIIFSLKRGWYFMRTVRKDHVFRDKEFRVGQPVLLIYPSANRDAEIFDDV